MSHVVGIIWVLANFVLSIVQHMIGELEDLNRRVETLRGATTPNIVYHTFMGSSSELLHLLAATITELRELSISIRQRRSQKDTPANTGGRGSGKGGSGKGGSGKGGSGKGGSGRRRSGKRGSGGRGW